ncbi:MAG TPA: CHAP domain-containing protein [Polyangiaceae bacterium]|nr:CHAP domain-containing protein [Polyangiaceae bacterium]
MTALGRLLGTASVGAMLLACGNAPSETEELGVTRQEVNACDETVPATRAVDGFPAYAQCAGVENGPIWSNNGIDTASSSQGQGWVRTQGSGGYQCTEFARRYFMFRWGIDYQHGNAGEWCEGTLPSTLTIAPTPTHGDLIVFAPGSCGADATTGHVAVVDTVDMAGGKVTVVEQNQASRRSTQQSCAACFLHAVKNDGSPGGSGAGGGSGAAGAAAAGAAAGGTANGTAGTPPMAGSSSGEPITGGAAGGGGTSNVGTSGNASVGGAAVSGGANSGGATSSTAGSTSAGSTSTGNAAKDDSSCSVGRAGSSNNLGGAAGLLLIGVLLLRRRPA